jgi:hypothetical protein
MVHVVGSLAIATHIFIFVFSNVQINNKIIIKFLSKSLLTLECKLKVLRVKMCVTFFYFIFLSLILNNETFFVLLY